MSPQNKQVILSENEKMKLQNVLISSVGTLCLQQCLNMIQHALILHCNVVVLDVSPLLH